MTNKVKYLLKNCALASLALFWAHFSIYKLKHGF